MPTTREVQAAHTQRMIRQRRHWTTDLLGPGCPVCGLRIPRILTDQGATVHATCDPLARHLLDLDQARLEEERRHDAARLEQQPTHTTAEPEPTP